MPHTQTPMSHTHRDTHTTYTRHAHTTHTHPTHATHTPHRHIPHRHPLHTHTDTHTTYTHAMHIPHRHTHRTHATHTHTHTHTTHTDTQYTTHRPCTHTPYTNALHAHTCLAHTYTTHTHTYPLLSWNRNTLPAPLGQRLGRTQAPDQPFCHLQAYLPPQLCGSQGTGGRLRVPALRGGPWAWDPWTAASGSTHSEGISCAGTTTRSSASRPDRGDRV